MPRLRITNRKPNKHTAILNVIANRAATTTMLFLT